jgi:hypothetical protein
LNTFLGLKIVVYLKNFKAMYIITNPDKADAQPKKIGAKAESFIKKMIEDKKIIRTYIEEGKDLSELTQKRGIRFAKPL